MQARRAALAAAGSDDVAGEAWLFFGCRTADEDYLYREEFEAMAADGTLTKLETAFSRAGPEKVSESPRTLWSLFLVPDAPLEKGMGDPRC
jgi:sulfite reductase alpha subunit-like flavoprotein